MEFISREAAIKAVNDRAADFIPYLRGISEMIPLEIAGAIVRVPSADVRPVRHGQWEDVQFRTIPHNRIAKAKKCSECGKRKDKYVTWIYCPNCGAKMDKEER